VKISKKLLQKIIREEIELSFKDNLDKADGLIRQAAELIVQFHKAAGDTRQDTIKAIEGRFENISDTGMLADILNNEFGMKETKHEN
jgi:hypothetical protein|tara:strand:- start:339 stop:599 length:261 start_codon:yes stop_codon:yes gene_type:complete